MLTSVQGKLTYLRTQAGCDLDCDVVADRRNLLEDHGAPEPKGPCKAHGQNMMHITAECW